VALSKTKPSGHSAGSAKRVVSHKLVVGGKEPKAEGVQLCGTRHAVWADIPRVRHSTGHRPLGALYCADRTCKIDFYCCPQEPSERISPDPMASRRLTVYGK
jgi:hypothetical protein